MKEVRDRLNKSGKTPEEIAEFENGAKVAAKSLLEKFDQYDFYTGESMDTSGM